MKEYWTSEVEEALAKYVRCEDNDEKNEIYTKYLHEPFQKLIDITVKRYRPDAKNYDDDTKLMLLSNLILMVDKFNPDVVLLSGRKPTGHSYCSIIVRSSIAQYTVKDARQNKNIGFDDWYKDNQEI